MRHVTSGALSVIRDNDSDHGAVAHAVHHPAGVIRTVGSGSLVYVSHEDLVVHADPVPGNFALPAGRAERPTCLTDRRYSGYDLGYPIRIRPCPVVP